MVPSLSSIITLAMMTTPGSVHQRWRLCPMGAARSTTTTAVAYTCLWTTALELHGCVLVRCTPLGLGQSTLVPLLTNDMYLTRSVVCVHWGVLARRPCPKCAAAHERKDTDESHKRVVFEAGLAPKTLHTEEQRARRTGTVAERAARAGCAPQRENPWS